MVHYEVETTIQRPIQQVFDYLADVECLPNWVATIQRSTLTSPGPVRKGTTFVQTLKLLGHTFESVMEVTTCRPPQRFEFAGTSGSMRAPDQLGTHAQRHWNAGRLDLRWRECRPLQAE